MTSMQCADIKALLSGLVDDQVDPETRHLAERHLASCRPCRALIDEAESLDRLIAMDVEPIGDALPAGFEDRVMDRAGGPLVFTPYSRRLSTWLGWVAAAAALALAVTIWVTDRRDFLNPQINPSMNDSVAQVAPDVVEDIEAPMIAPAQPPHVVRATYTRPVFGNHMAPDYNSLLSPNATDDAPPFEPAPSEIDADREAATPSPAISALGNPTFLSDEDVQTLYNASILLDMMAEADTTSFHDLEMARQIAEYDDLLSRLAEARKRMPVEDRPLVFAAESILTRVVAGTLDLQDLRDMRDTILRLELSRRVESLSDRGPVV